MELNKQFLKDVWKKTKLDKMSSLDEIVENNFNDIQDEASKLPVLEGMQFLIQKGNEIANNLLKEEAMKRLSILESLGLNKKVKNDFSRGRLPFFDSEVAKFDGTIIKIPFYVKISERVKQENLKLIEDFQRENGGLVYLAELTHTAVGDLLSLFYVSLYDEEWDDDRNDLNDGYSLVNCLNLTNPMFSELGTIGFKIYKGDISRIS